MKKLIIIGAGGHARETAWVAKAAGFEVVGFLDDDISKHGKITSDFICLGPVSDVINFKDYFFAVAIGNPRVRKKVVDRLSQFVTLKFATIIHPSVTILNPKNHIGEGSVIFPGVMLMEAVEIGSHVIVNLNASISHDSVVNDFTTLNPRSTICGNCHIGCGVEMGAGSTVIQGIEIGSGAFVGAGATVTKHVNANSLYVGVPAKPLKLLEAFE